LVFLGEPMGVFEMVGGLLIIGGAMAVSIPRPKPPCAE
jgi:drug/metabolite transporter (DMT)-like permease